MSPHTFADIYTHLLSLPPPLAPPSRLHSQTLTSQIASLLVHPTLEAALHILNQDLPSAHFLVRHMQAAPAHEGMLLHAILHRVEGDYENAKGWYAKVEGEEVMRKVWVGGKEEAWGFVERVEGWVKRKEGKGEDLEVESRREIERVVEVCRERFGDREVPDASEAWAQPEEGVMLVGGKGGGSFEASLKGERDGMSS